MRVHCVIAPKQQKQHRKMTIASHAHVWIVHQMAEGIRALLNATDTCLDACIFACIVVLLGALVLLMIGQFVNFVYELVLPASCASA